MLNYAWIPHKTSRLTVNSSQKLYDGVNTLEEAQELVADKVYAILDAYSSPLINDVAYLSIYSGLRHTTDPDVLGLAADRIPQANTQDKTLSFLIALYHEKHININDIIEKEKARIIFDLNIRKYRLEGANLARSALILWTKRADKIAELMDTASEKVGILSTKAEFIRNWALVDLVEEIGIEASAANNNINISFTDETQSNLKTTSQLVANKTMKVIKLEDTKLPPAGHRNNETDTLTITSKNGANFYNIKDSAGNWSLDAQLAKDASKTFTFAEATYGIRTRPIAVPGVYQEISDQSLNVGVIQSVSLDVTFSGVLLTVTAESNNEGICTVVVAEHGSGLAITGVAAGTTTIDVTATNPSGSVTETFTVTVTEAPSGD